MILKKWLTISGLIACILPLLAGCGGGGGSTDNGNNGNGGASPPSAVSSWTIGTSRHEGSAAASRQNNTNNIVITVAGTAGADSANGPYAGSVVTIQAIPEGSGTYTLAPSLTELLRIQQDSPGTAAAYLTAQAGTVQVNPLASTLWRSVTGSLTVVVDDSGLYRYSTTEPRNLTREIDLGDGIPESPDQIDVTLDNVFGTTTF